MTIPAKTKSQMANELGMSLRTFQRRLEKAHLQVPRGLILGHQQVFIREKLAIAEYPPATNLQG